LLGTAAAPLLTDGALTHRLSAQLLAPAIPVHGLIERLPELLRPLIDVSGPLDPVSAALAPVAVASLLSPALRAMAATFAPWLLLGVVWHADVRMDVQGRLLVLLVPLLAAIGMLLWRIAGSLPRLAGRQRTAVLLGIVLGYVAFWNLRTGIERFRYGDPVDDAASAVARFVAEAPAGFDYAILGQVSDHVRLLAPRRTVVPWRGHEALPLELPRPTVLIATGQQSPRLELIASRFGAQTVSYGRGAFRFQTLLLGTGEDIGRPAARRGHPDPAVSGARSGQSWAWPGGRPLEASDLRLSSSRSAEAHLVANAVDGDPRTRWDSGTAQEPEQWFQFDLPAPSLVRAVRLDTSRSAMDYPRALQLAISEDGVLFRPLEIVRGASPVIELTFLRKFLCL
jgi:hypothetical protein